MNAEPRWTGRPDPASALPLSWNVNAENSASDVVDLLRLARFATGEQPFAMRRNLQRVRRHAALRPDGSQVLRAVSVAGRRTHLTAGEGWTLTAVRWNDDTAELEVTATSDELARRVIEESVVDACEPEPQDVEANVGFWYFHPGRGVRQIDRSIATPAWTDIRHNYPAAARHRLDELMAMTPARLRGRLILMHGLPGTGKTTALRSLADAWRDWCRVDCILDPERLFGDTAYLYELATEDDDADPDDDLDGGGDTRPWRLLILEDCDELIHGEAKREAGQAMSRLLNLTDGMLAQGRNLLVAITTNEDLARLHPGIVRPGRCLAQIEVGPLSHADAVTWLGSPVGVPTGGATLAELYALRDGRTLDGAAVGPSIGGYL